MSIGAVDIFNHESRMQKGLYEGEETLVDLFYYKGIITPHKLSPVHGKNSDLNFVRL